MPKSVENKDIHQRLGDIINRERRQRRLSLRQLVEKVKKEDGGSITPQYLNDIEFNRRTPSPHVLRELARELGQDPDLFLMLAGAGTEVVREYLKEYPQEQEDVIQLFRAAQKRGFEDWERLRKIVEKSKKDSK